MKKKFWNSENERVDESYLDATTPEFITESLFFLDSKFLTIYLIRFMREVVFKLNLMEQNMFLNNIFSLI
jgi:hypothetical protein